MYSIKTITTWNNLEAIKNSWNNLASIDSHATIFQSYNWHHAWWQVFGSGHQLHILTARYHDEIIGILPLMITKQGHIEFLSTPETEYHNAIIHPDHTEVLPHLVESLLALQNKNQLILSELPTASSLAHEINRQIKEFSLSHTQELTATFRVSVHTPFNKRDIKSRRKKLTSLLLNKEGITMKSSRYKDDNCSKILDHFFTWHHQRFAKSLSRYRRRQLSPQFKTFYQKLLEHFPENAKLSYLELDNTPIATMMVLSDKRATYDLLPSHNPKLTHYSPGSILLQDTINHAQDTDTKIFDFLRGDEGFKMRFAHTSIPLTRLTIFKSPKEKHTHQGRVVLKSIIRTVILKLNEQYTKSSDTKEIIKRIIFWCLYYSGVAPLYQTLTKHRERILCYHSISNHPLRNPILSVTPKTFEKQIQHIKKSFIAGYHRSARSRLRDSLLVTFDDGYQDNYTHAYPILNKYGIQAIIFPTIIFVEEGQIPSWHGEPNFPALTWNEIKEMHESDLVTFGSHTLTHPNLAKLTDNEIIHELSESKKIMESHLENLNLTTFNLQLAYPFGKPKHIPKSAKKIAASLGFTHAYSLTEGTNTKNTDPYNLKRLVIFDEPLFMFKVRVSGIIDDLLTVLKQN